MQFEFFDAYPYRTLEPELQPLVLTDRPPATFAEKVIAILQQKYDQRGGKMGGKNYCERMKKALAGPMACAIHLQ